MRGRKGEALRFMKFLAQIYSWYPRESSTEHDSKESLVVGRVKEPHTALTMSYLRAKLSYHESQTDLGNIQRLESL